VRFHEVGEDYAISGGNGGDLERDVAVESGLGIAFSCSGNGLGGVEREFASGVMEYQRVIFVFCKKNYDEGSYHACACALKNDSAPVIIKGVNHAENK
jgi:hypothetical protein